MQVTIENFGPICRVEYDLAKDLSVVFGRNNIGKSYGLTAVYLLLKVLRNHFEHIPYSDYHNVFNQRRWLHPFYPEDDPGGLYEQAAASLRAAFTKNPSLRETDATPVLEQLLRDDLRGTADTLADAFGNSFPPLDQLTTKLTSEPLTITVRTAVATLVYQLDGADARRLLLAGVRLTQPAVVRKIKNNRRPALNDQHTVLYFKEGAQVEKAERSKLSVVYDDIEVLTDATWHLLTRIRYDVFQTANHLFYLPASRSGLYQALSAFGAVVAELSKSRRFVKNPLTLPSIAEPLSDYFLELSNLNTQYGGGAIHELGLEIETELLGGRVGFNEQTKKLTFRPFVTDQEIDLAYTSSMVSEISPIVAFLKHIIPETEKHPDDEYYGLPLPERPTLLFIEEPEAHLHPEVQVRLLTFFARLTAHRVKVMMTTHSNYMFNKLSNLLLAGELKPEHVGSYLLINTPTGSIIAPDAMTAEAEGIADENFADVTERLYNERLRAYAAQEPRAD